MTEQIQIVLNGAAGRMGRAVAAAAREGGGVEICAAVERPDHADLGTDLGILSGCGVLGVIVAERPERPPTSAQVLVDFSEPDAAVAAARWAASSGLGIVIGTTGFSLAQEDGLRALASTVPMVVAPNMSLGVNLLFGLVAEAAGALGGDYDVEIVEAHHRHKKDAPSGTARRLLEVLRGGRLSVPGAGERYGRHGEVVPRSAGEIGIHAVRGGDIVGDHTVIFAGPGERLELTHRATSREAFARGVLRAVRFVAVAEAGWYSMAGVLGLE